MYSTPKDDIIIASGNPDDPTKSFDSNMVPNADQDTIIIPEKDNRGRKDIEDTWLINSAMAASEFILKTKALVDTYKDKVHEFRKKNPEKWKKFLEEALEEYKKNPMHLEMMVELLAVNTIDFEEQLKEGFRISPISEKLIKVLADQDSETKE